MQQNKQANKQTNGCVYYIMCTTPNKIPLPTPSAGHVPILIGAQLIKMSIGRRETKTYFLSGVSYVKYVIEPKVPVVSWTIGYAFRTWEKRYRNPSVRSRSRNRMRNLLNTTIQRRLSDTLPTETPVFPIFWSSQRSDFTYLNTYVWTERTRFLLGSVPSSRIYCSSLEWWYVEF